MPITVRPYIPTYITVHLGPPDWDVENVTVPFADYIKNVASSEIYPTWETSALRANILAQISFALNRVYTEFYPSRGYPFQITSSTAYDQKFIKGRNIFDSVSVLVDELFNDYIRRQGFVEPLAARFCNGTTSQCDGLSQWGSEYLAREGRNSLEILTTYYGENIELVVDAPIQALRTSYPGTAMGLGDASPSIRIAQFMLDRISRAYPAIPKITRKNGYYGLETQAAVRAFQQIFDLSPDGILGKATWYAMVRIYTGILQLSELASEGQQFGSLLFDYEAFNAADLREQVSLLQYLLSVLSQFYLEIPFVTMDGVFGNQTRNAVIALQRSAGLPETGVVDEATWDVLVERFLAIDRTVLLNEEFFPFRGLAPGELQEALARQPDQFPGQTLTYGQSS
ncbi:MAG: peptidoglycan-binding protein [Ruminiclostridium sp.]|nr:peptidoglycan-binding protein [Ruminiclostridium sp.]